MKGIYGVAVLQCSGCPGTFRMKLRQLPAPEIIDKKAKSTGWRLDPHVCPGCQLRAREKKMATTTAPTPAALAATGKMHRLLDNHFDAEAGRYADGWDDNRVSKDVGLNADLVAQYRVACFGELKVPVEVASLQQDIKALVDLKAETDAQFAQQIAQLRTRAAELARKFAA
jgi:hypothetical protein